MTTINELARRLQSAMMRGQFTDWRKMYTGRRTSTGITLAGADTGKTWVRAEEDSREETQVWGSASRVNLPVWVGPNIAGELELKTLEQTEAAMTAGAAAAASLLPTITPENSPNILIDGRQFRPGRLRLSDLGGLYVYAEPFQYDGGYWPGGNLALTPPGTANQQAWCVVAFDPATGTLSQFTGDEYALPVILGGSELAQVNITAGYIPLGGVVLQNGQTAITGAEVWGDLRYHFAQAGGDISGVVLIAPESSTRNVIQPTGDYTPLTVKGDASQTDTLFEAQDSSGTVLAKIAADGDITAPDITATGTATSVTLDVNGSGTIQKLLTDASAELTIASGAVTVTQTFHRIDTESDAASDDLTTINGGADGQFLVIRAENTAREVVVTTAGNITTSDGNNVSLDELYKFVLLIYDGNRSKWNVVGGGGGAGGSGTYYQTVKDDGSAMTQRSALNLISGAGITLTIADDSGNDETDVTIAVSAAGGGIDVSDGVTTVSPTTLLTFPSGIISDEGAGEAKVNYPTAVQSYTPTLAAETTNPTLGSSTLTGSYCFLAPGIMWVSIKLTITTGGSWNAGSGIWGLTLPSGWGAATERVPVPMVIDDADVGPRPGQAYPKISSAQLDLAYANGWVTHSAPQTWATGDTIGVQGVLQVNAV